MDLRRYQFPSNEFAHLSLKDLLDARDQYHVEPMTHPGQTQSTIAAQRSVMRLVICITMPALKKLLRTLASIAVTVLLAFPCPLAAQDGSTGVLGDTYSLGIPESSGLASTNVLATTDLVTGVTRSSIPLELPRARGAVQPELTLHYNSTYGDRDIGFGWSLDLPAIERRNLSGPPRYNDPAPGALLDAGIEDRFVFNGQPLVPICLTVEGFCGGVSETEPMPPWAQTGWHYFRLQREGAFLRFFWSPDHQTWRVQAKSGETMEFGVALVGPKGDSSGIDLDENNPDAISGNLFRWNLVRRYDAQGGDLAFNLVVYQWVKLGDRGLGYLTDIFFTPKSGFELRDVASYAHHVRLVYARDDFPYLNQATMWRTTPDRHLTRVDVASRSINGIGARELVRRYHLQYGSQLRHSRLFSVTMEGRCEQPIVEGSGQDLPTPTSCPQSDRAIMGYTNEGITPPKHWTVMKGGQPSALAADGSPEYLRMSLLDIDGDGLPDLLLPSLRPSQPQSLWLNSPGTEADDFFGTPCASPGAIDCAAPMGMLSPVVGANTRTLFSRDIGTTVAGDWFGEGTMNAWFIARGWNVGDDTEIALYAPRHLGDVGWLWSGGRTGKRTTSLLSLVADIDGDGLPDLVPDFDFRDIAFGKIAFTTKTPDGNVHPFEQMRAVRSAPFDEIHVAATSDLPPLLVDMNGDGVPDIVIFTKNRDPGGFGYRVTYWPGNGLGDWAASQDGIAMGISGFQAYLHDVNGDGLADLVNIEPDGVRIRRNIDGRTFEPIGLLVHWPDLLFRPEGGLVNYRVAFADMNGNGVDDIVLIPDGRPIHYFDYLGGVTPGLLNQIDNGHGASASFDYASTPELARAAREAGTPWTSQSPQIMHVVTSFTTTNHLPGRFEDRRVTRITYQDPVYDGWERQFLGFQRVRVTRPGDGTAPESSTETTFLLGACEDYSFPCGAATDQNAPLRWVSARPVLVETQDPFGEYLSTEHTQYRVTDLYNGIDGRKVRVADALISDAWRYDTDNFDAKEQRVTLAELDGSDPTPTLFREIVLRSTAGRQFLSSGQAFDRFGNQILASETGRRKDDLSFIDEPIVRRNKFQTVGPDGSWMWRIAQSRIAAFPAPRPEVPQGPNRVANFEYDDAGHLLNVTSDLQGTLPLERFHENPARAVAPPPPSASVDGPVRLFSATYDVFGNVAQVSGPAGRCQRFDYDNAYSELRVRRTVYTADPCTGVELTTRYIPDRGLGVVVQTLSPAGLATRAVFDGFGRLAEFFLPDPANPGSTSSEPALKVQYHLDLTSPALQRTDVMVRDTNAEGWRHSWILQDGFGSRIATFNEADASLEPGSWVLSGLARRSAKGLVERIYAPSFTNDDPSTFQLDPNPTGDSVSFVYDAFERPRLFIGLDRKLAYRYVRHALSDDVYDAAALDPSSPRYNIPTTIERDGHGRTIAVTSRLRQAAGMDAVQTQYFYLSTGETTASIRSHSLGPDTISRWMQYDSLGRVVLNAEPNTAAGFTSEPGKAGAMKAWRYAYDDANQLVGTSDARGCGENFFYDAAGRLKAEDYSPCLMAQANYTAPDLQTGGGTEAFYQYDEPEPGQTTDFGGNPALLVGRLVSVRDRGAHTRYAVDGRGRVMGVARRLAQPGTAAASPADRYANWWFRMATAFDAANRVARQSTGADVPELLGPDGASDVTMDYSRRGIVRAIGGSYGPLLTRQARAADGLVITTAVGDVARTLAHFDYDGQRRITSIRVLRDGPAPWVVGHGYSPPTETPSTLQFVLEDLALDYDDVGNPVAIRDVRAPTEWPEGARPQSRALDYDDFNRVAAVRYDAAGDRQVSPFEAEESRGDRSPVPSRVLPKRVQQQTFAYQWNGNLAATSDDAQAIYDRSLGSIVNGVGTNRPEQFTSAGSGDNGVRASYDDAGNLAHLLVDRTGTCSDPAGRCSQRYDYDWDEVGRLVRARRWDALAGRNVPPPQIPSPAADADLRYSYSQGRRALRSISIGGAAALHSAEIFPSLGLRSAPFDGTRNNYVRSATTEVVRPTDFSQVVYLTGNVPTVDGRHQHVFFRFSDRLDSTSTVFDRDTSELVEQVTYQGYGRTDADYRPARWASYRDVDRFNGKEADLEVDLVYYGARYYQPSLGRWLSPDPAAVHAMAANLNVYAFAVDSPLRNVDSNGLGGGCLGLEQGCDDGSGNDGNGGGDGSGFEGGGGGGGGGSGASSGPSPPPPAGPSKAFDPWAGTSWVTRWLNTSNDWVATEARDDRSWAYAQNFYQGVSNGAALIALGGMFFGAVGAAEAEAGEGALFAKAGPAIATTATLAQQTGALDNVEREVVRDVQALTPEIQAISSRVAQLQNQMHPAAGYGGRTVTILRTTNSDLVATGVRDLAPAMRSALTNQEQAVKLFGAHGEPTVLMNNDILQRIYGAGVYLPRILVTSTNICDICKLYIQHYGGILLTPRVAVWLGL